jgi:hypothetical protein
VTKKKPAERMFAVAIRDGVDLFLWICLRRSKTGDIYYMLPTGRTGSDWERWDPQGSLHKDGRFHSKSYGQEIFPQQRQKLDSNFKGTLQLVTRPLGTTRKRREPSRGCARFSYLLRNIFSSSKNRSVAGSPSKNM